MIAAVSEILGFWMQLLQSDKLLSIKPFFNQTIHIQSTAIAKAVKCCCNSLCISSLGLHKINELFTNLKTIHSLLDISHTDTNLLLCEDVCCLISHDAPKLMHCTCQLSI